VSTSATPTAPAAALRKTALNATHRRLGAKMVDFGGWDMPVEYSGLIAEHMAVRTGVGVFDVSHMGDIQLRGPGSLAAVQHISMNDAAKLKEGQAHYSALLYPNGTFVDDVIVHKFSENDYLLVINAGTREKDVNWVRQNVGRMHGVHVSDYSDYYTQLAIQGPKAVEVLRKLTDRDLDAIKNYWFTWGTVCGLHNTLIARTGYTGEDGFEIFVPPQSADKVWLALLESGEAADVIPCGLGARDTLRLEAGMRLHGNDIDETTTAVEADLNWIVGWKKDDFIGAAALREQKANGVTRKIVGFEMLDRGIGRHGYDAYVGDAKVGVVTSGTQTPFLKKAIGMAYLPLEHTAPGIEFGVDIRGRHTRARVVPLPFYKRQK
jgi:aminomethyltransferase